MTCSSAGRPLHSSSQRTEEQGRLCDAVLTCGLGLMLSRQASVAHRRHSVLPVPVGLSSRALLLCRCTIYVNGKPCAHERASCPYQAAILLKLQRCLKASPTAASHAPKCALDACICSFVFDVISAYLLQCLDDLLHVCKLRGASPQVFRNDHKQSTAVNCFRAGKPAFEA